MALYKDLLGHNLEKFGAVTVFDATFYDPVTNKPLITFDTLTVSNISVESEQKEIRGGQGANLLVSYDYGKNATVEITDALASMFSLQYIMGSRLKEDFTALVRKEFELDGSTATLTFDPAPVLTESLTYIKIDKDGLHTQVEVANATASISGLSNIVKVIAYYTVNYTGAGKSHVKELTLTSVDFPPVVKMVGETIFIDVKTGRRIAAQIEIPKFKLNTDFELTFEAEGDASTFDFSGVALADGKKLIQIRTLGYLDGDDDPFFDQDAGSPTGKNPE